MLETLNPRKRVRVWNPATQEYEEKSAFEGTDAGGGIPTLRESLDRYGARRAAGEGGLTGTPSMASPEEMALSESVRRLRSMPAQAKAGLNIPGTPEARAASWQPKPVATGGLLHEAASLIPQTAPAAAQTPLMTDKERDFNTERADLNNLRSTSKKRGQEMLTEADRLETAGQTDHAAFIRSVARLLIAGVTDPTTIPSLAVRQALAHELSSIPRGVITAEGGYHGGLMRTSEQAAGRGQWVDPRILQRNAGEKATRETGLAKTEAEGAIAKGQAGLIGSAAAVAAQGAALGPEGRARLAGAGGAGMAMDETIDLAMRQRAADQQANKGNPNAQIPPLEEYVDRMKRIRTGQPPPAPAPAQPGVLMGLAQAAGKGMLQTLFPREAGVVWPQGKPNIAPRGQPSPLPVPPVSSAPPGMAPQPQRLPTLGGPAATPGGAVGRLFGAGAPRAPAPQVAAPVAQAAPVSGSKTVGEVLGPQAGPWAGKPITEFTAALRANPRDPALRQLAQALRAAGY